MAYKQNPGRGNSPKTGHGIPSPLKQDSEASKAVGKYKSNKKLGERDMSIEVAAASDSISAARPNNPHLYTSKEKGEMGNVAANKTRTFNESSITVEKKSVLNPRTGYSNVFSKKSVSK